MKEALKMLPDSTSSATQQRSVHLPHCAPAMIEQPAPAVADFSIPVETSLPQSLLPENMEPGCASSAALDGSLVDEFRPKSSPSEQTSLLDIQSKVFEDLAATFVFKWEDKKRWQSLRHKGMVEFPTELALKTARLLFQSDHEVLQKATFLRDRAAYEPHPGFVYCDAGNGIMALYFDRHVSELTKKSSHLGELVGTNDDKKADPFEVLLAYYRDDPSPQAREALKFLERELQQILEDEYESQIPVQTGVANTDEEERELVEPGAAITDEKEQELQGAVKIVLDATMNWDLEDTKARQTQSRGRRDEYDADARQMQEADAQRRKQQMLEFKARSLFLSFLV